MDSSYFFMPNLSFGGMTFTQVKVIDIEWDLCVGHGGHGGQMLLAWMNLSSVTAWDESCRLVYLSRTAAYMRLAG
jgi:hypothetical protein